MTEIAEEGVVAADRECASLSRLSLPSTRFRSPRKTHSCVPPLYGSPSISPLFWHRHLGCWWTTNPSSNTEFWAAKFDQNIRRDARNIADLGNLGWRVAVTWECALRLQGLEEVALAIGCWLKGGGKALVLPNDKEMRRSSRAVPAAPKLKPRKPEIG